MDEKIIFLDIDGVLSPEKQKNSVDFDMERLWSLMKEYQNHENDKILNYLINVFEPYIINDFIEILKKYKAKIVVHSTWINFPGEEITMKILREVGLFPFFHTNWCVEAPLTYNVSKKSLIESWLNQNETKSFIIIDDDIICQDLISNQLKPNTYMGMNKRHFVLLERFLSN